MTENTNITNEIINTADVATSNMLIGLEKPSSQFYCSIPDDGKRENKVAIYNAINTEGERLIDHIGETLDIVDIAAHTIQVANEQTGEISEVLRTILIASDGTTYSCVSSGVMESLKKIFAIVGVPSWANDPVHIIPKEIRTRGGRRVLTLELK